MRKVSRRRAVVAVEMACCAPLLCFFLVAGIELFMLQTSSAMVNHYAEAGAQFARASMNNANNQSGIANAALMDASPAFQSTALGPSDLATATVTSSVSTTDGINYFATVTVTIPFMSATGLLPNQLSATRSYIVQRSHK